MVRHRKRIEGRPLRRFAPPPHEWGGDDSPHVSIEKNLAGPPPALRATSPQVGRRRFASMVGIENESRAGPSGASRHLPTSGEEKIPSMVDIEKESSRDAGPSGASRHLPTSGEEWLWSHPGR